MPSTITDRLYGLTTSVAVKAPCRVVATANITLSGLQTIDGVALAANDRVLNIGQTTGADNGIWLAQSGTWTRPGDWDGSLDAVMGTQILVNSGTDNALSQWIVTTSGTIIVGTTSVALRSPSSTSMPTPPSPPARSAR
jgi:phage-related tail fiber protein